MTESNCYNQCCYLLLVVSNLPVLALAQQVILLHLGEWLLVTLKERI